MKKYLSISIASVLALIAPGIAKAQIYVTDGNGTAVASDLANPFTALDFVNPGNGYAQQFTIASGNWNVTRAQLYLGMQDPTYPVTPVLQVRDASGAGGGPGAVLGSFSINPNDIPPWKLNVNNFGTVTAPVNSNFTLGVGSYWLCLIHTGSIGGFMGGFATANPLTQTGVAGNVIMQDGIQLSYDGGQTFAPGLGGYALLMELDGTTVPEPASMTILISLGGLVLCPALRRNAASRR